MESEFQHREQNDFAAANMLGKVLKQTVIPDTREVLEREGADSPRFARGFDTCMEILDSIIETFPQDRRSL